MKLQQGQIWKTGEAYIRIVHLERLEVKYKSMADLATGVGTHHHVTKKEFCRLIKNAELLDPKRKQTMEQQVESVDSPEETSAS